MVGDRGAAPISVAVLHVRATLANKLESERFENAADFPWLENGRSRHELRRHSDALRADELPFQARFPILKQHRDNFLQVVVQLVQRCGLCVGAWESRDVANKQFGVRAPLNDCSVTSHAQKIIACGGESTRCKTPNETKLSHGLRGVQVASSIGTLAMLDIKKKRPSEPLAAAPG